MLGKNKVNIKCERRHTCVGDTVSVLSAVCLQTRVESVALVITVSSYDRPDQGTTLR